MKSVTPPADRLAAMSEHELAAFERRRQLITKLADGYRVSVAATAAVAKELNLSPRSVRRLVARFRAGDGNALALVPKPSGRRSGRRLLDPVVEGLIHDVLTRTYVNKQRPSFAHAYKQLRHICRERQIKAPSVKAVKARLLDFDPVVVARRRHGLKAAQTLKPIVGRAPEAEYPLHIVQIDHTKADVQLVDSVHRKVLGRPHVTFAIDLYSRCIVGFNISLEAPSSATVALCMISIAEDKDALLQQRGVEGSWPIQGVPGVLHLDSLPAEDTSYICLRANQKSRTGAPDAWEQFHGSNHGISWSR